MVGSEWGRTIIFEGSMMITIAMTLINDVLHYQLCVHKRYSKYIFGPFTHYEAPERTVVYHFSK